MSLVRESIYNVHHVSGVMPSAGNSVGTTKVCLSPQNELGPTCNFMTKI